MSRSLSTAEEMSVAGVLDGEEERLIERFRATGWKDLDLERQAFALAYRNTWSPTLAAKELGRDAAYGRRMMRDPILRACLHDVSQAVMEESILNERVVHANMQRVFEMSIGDEPRPMVVDGCVVEANVPDLSTARQVAEWQGKTLGLAQTDHKNKRGSVNITLNFGAVDGSQKEVGVIIDAEDDDE